MDLARSPFALPFPKMPPIDDVAGAGEATMDSHVLECRGFLCFVKTMWEVFGPSRGGR